MSREDFWSRRKASVAKEQEAETAELLLEAEPDLDEEAELSDEELLAKYELPDPDGMEEGDDFSAFMKSAVPERLRNRALRKLWLTNPTLANVDGLVDYGEDFTDAAMVVENMQTVYQVGKGMVQKLLEVDEEEGADGVALAKLPNASEPDDADADMEEETNPTESLEIEEAPQEASIEEVSDPSEAEIPLDFEVKPRMRFTFAENG